MDFSTQRLRFILYHSINLTLNNNINKSGGIPFQIVVEDKNKNKVPTVLYLELENPNFQYEYDHEFVYPLDEIMKSNNTGKLLLSLVNSAKGIQDLVSSKQDIGGKNVFDPGSGAGRNLGSQMITSVYQKAPAYKSTSELKLPSNLTFKFYYGQRGLFNCWSEVVYPLMCLFEFFLPTDSGGSIGELPLPTPTQVLANATIGVLKSVPAAPIADGGDENSNIDVDIGTEEKESSSNQTATQDQENMEIFKKVSQVVDNVNKIVPTVYTGYKGICRGVLQSVDIDGNPLGVRSTPIFTFKNVACKMDFSKLDSNGYPFAGTLTLGGVSSLSVAVKEVL